MVTSASAADICHRHALHEIVSCHLERRGIQQNRESGFGLMHTPSATFSLLVSAFAALVNTMSRTNANNAFSAPLD
jgi:hypothetical protein